jgi:predicted ATPase
MLGQARNAALLVIAAYRDNEVDAAHPAMLMAEEVKKSDTPVSKLVLGPLAIADTSQFVADSLRVDPSVAAPLAELLHGRTGGNPFFLVQLLHSLEHERLLSPSADGESWRWDLPQIRERGLTDDVISLMTARLRELPPETQTLLKLAACLGNKFDLELLSAAHGRPFEDTQRELWPALAEELVVPSEALRRRSPKRRSQFRFLHDRVQQAAYALWDDDERAKAHYRLGWLLLRTLSGDQVESAIFDVVGHLNHGLSTLGDVQEREQIARLNVRAGMRAKAASAHRAAAGNFSTAMSLFSAEIWQADFPLAYELHCARAECEYLIGNFETADSLAIAAYAHCRTTLERARLYSIRVSIYITQGNLGLATQAGLEALRLFGHDVPADPHGAAMACSERAAQL